MSAARHQPLEFSHYSGAGNDFIVLDERHGASSTRASTHAKALCRRGVSVGADGLILIDVNNLDAGVSGRMRLWNADGTSAEFSGNAARCAVRYLVDEGLAAGPVRLQTGIGVVNGYVDGTNVRVDVPGTAAVWPQRRIRVEGRDLVGTYVQIGVPFFVLMHEDPDELPVRYLGRAIRNHPDLKPAGANVDFVRVDDEQNLYFRVYERGVEAETLSSGTGSIAAALAAAAAHRAASPIACHTRGGTLTVRFHAVTAAVTEEASSAPEADTRAATDTTTEAVPEVPGDQQTGAAKNDESPATTEPPSTTERLDAPDLPRVAEGSPLRFTHIEVEGDTRQVMRGTAFADALRLE